MIKIHNDLIQGGDEWIECRRGLLTASEMKLVVSKKTDKKTGIISFSAPSEDKVKAHLYELVAQRVTGYVEPFYIGDDMLRGMEDEIYARALYEEKYAPTETVGFITNNKWGFTLGFSPDGLVGDDGIMECKSRRQKYQIQTITDDKMPDDYLIQVQTGLLVSERKWCDFISYSGGMPMFIKRVYADDVVQTAIVEAAQIFHGKMDLMIADYEKKIVGLHPTERRINDGEITLTDGE